MKLFLIPLLIAGYLVSGCSPETGTQIAEKTFSTGNDYFIVQPEAALFIFELDTAETWHWYLKSTEVNVLEYGWGAVFNLDGMRYDAGFKLFKFSRNRPAAGPLEELIDAGQVDVWTVNTENRSPVGGSTWRVSDIPLEAVVESNILTLILRDEGLVKKFLSNRPEKVVFQYIHPNETTIRQDVNVIYQLNSDPDDESN